MKVPVNEWEFVQWQISSAVTEVQEAVLQQEPRLSKALIPVPTLHITLLVTHLANQEQIDQWVDAHAATYTNTINVNTCCNIDSIIWGAVSADWSECWAVLLCNTHKQECIDCFLKMDICIYTI